MKPNDKAIEAARAAILKAIAERNCIIAGVFDENNYDEFDASEAVEHSKIALDAAYAAQFQSEDYAGLVKELRERAGSYDSHDYHGEIELKAADAIEALLAERDDFAEQLALRSESGMAKDMQEIMRINNELVAERDALKGIVQRYQKLNKVQLNIMGDLKSERDALAAHLAPVEDRNLEILAAKEWIEATTDMPPRTAYTISERSLAGARAVIAAIRPHIEAAERERCAKVSERKKKQKYYDPNSIGWEGEWEIVDEFPKEGKQIATAIRSGK